MITLQCLILFLKLYLLKLLLLLFRQANLIILHVQAHLLMDEFAFVGRLWLLSSNWHLIWRLTTLSQPFLHNESSFFTPLEVPTGRVWHLLTVIAGVCTKHSYGRLAMLFTVTSKNLLSALGVWDYLGLNIASLILLYHQVIHTMLSQCGMRPILQILNRLCIHWLIHRIQVQLLLLSLLTCIGWGLSCIC